MDKKELVKISHLARLKLSEQELERFTDQIEVVFEYFNRISHIGTEGIEPLVYPLDGMESVSSLREDKDLETQNKEELLDLAPELLGNEYKVPPVVE